MRQYRPERKRLHHHVPVVRIVRKLRFADIGYVESVVLLLGGFADIQSRYGRVFRRRFYELGSGRFGGGEFLKRFLDGSEPQFGERENPPYRNRSPFEFGKLIRFVRRRLYESRRFFQRASFSERMRIPEGVHRHRNLDHVESFSRFRYEFGGFPNRPFVQFERMNGLGFYSNRASEHGYVPLESARIGFPKRSGEAYGNRQSRTNRVRRFRFRIRRRFHGSGGNSFVSSDPVHEFLRFLIRLRHRRRLIRRQFGQGELFVRRRLVFLERIFEFLALRNELERRLPFERRMRQLCRNGASDGFGRHGIPFGFPCYGQGR